MLPASAPRRRRSRSTRGTLTYTGAPGKISNVTFVETAPERVEVTLIAGNDDAITVDELRGRRTVRL